MNGRILRFDYLEQYRGIRSEILAAIEQVLESGQLILGEQVEAFERQFCEFLRTPGYGIGVGNGTDAIALALRAFGIRSGDEVITVANTAVATVSAIRMVGASPVFCDIKPDTLLMDAESAEKRITRRTKAVIPVHLFGNAVDMIPIMRLAGVYGLAVIEDCAQSCGTLLNGRHTGTWGDVGCFSFYPTKNLAAYGDGGLCFTRNRELADIIRKLRNYGCDGGQTAEYQGTNSRLDELQAAILQVKLHHLPQYLQKRRTVGEAYRALLSEKCQCTQTTGGAEQSYHQFVIQVENREQVIERLNFAGIDCGIHYPVPIHLHTAYRLQNAKNGMLPLTEAAAERILSLPCYPELPMDALQTICNAVISAIAACSSRNM